MILPTCFSPNICFCSSAAFACWATSIGQMVPEGLSCVASTDIIL